MDFNLVPLVVDYSWGLLAAVGVAVGLVGFFWGMWDKNGGNNTAFTIGTLLIFVSALSGGMYAEGADAKTREGNRNVAATAVATAAERVYGVQLTHEEALELTASTTVDDLNDGLEAGTFWQGEGRDLFSSGKVISIRLAWLGDEWALIDVGTGEQEVRELPKVD